MVLLLDWHPTTLPTSLDKFSIRTVFYQARRILILFTYTRLDCSHNDSVAAGEKLANG